MRRIWEALVLRILSWLYPSPPPEIEYGICICSHGRNLHEKGKYACNGHFPPEEDAKQEWKRKWKSCSCVFYIEDKDDDEGDDSEPEVPSNEELERLYTK